MNRICVYCGANPGARPAYAEGARDLGRTLAERGIGVVYGGGNVGLMGVLADAALAAGGEVIGVIPEALLEKELAHQGLTELRVVSSMHERKALMAELSDAFIAMPGGFGTFEELCEALTWTQLGLHAKPCGLYNIEGFYDPLIVLLDRATEDRFLRMEHRAILLEGSDPERILERLEGFEMPVAEKWIDMDET